MADEPEPLPVVRIEQFDGSHEHPTMQELRAEIERLRAALSEAVTIANGSGADFQWNVCERLRELKRLADGSSEQKTST